MANWIEDFGTVVGGVTEVLTKTNETIRTITGQKDSDPLKVPEQTTQDQAAKPVQAQAAVETPKPTDPWLPLLAIVGLLFLLD
jgi:hypothetical protein